MANPPTRAQMQQEIDDLQTQVNASSTTRSDLQQEIDDLRSQLNPLTAPTASDPDLTGAEVDNTPVIASPTCGPHRMTFVVPQPDDSVVSIGQAGPANRITDTGITGRTKTHVHWHTTDAPAPTMLLLGGPSTIELAGYGGSKTGSNCGFMTITNGNAFIDAQLQFLVTARTKDLVLRTIAEKYAILQSDAGSSEVNAKKSVTIHGGEGVFISSADFAPKTINYTDDWTEVAKDESLKLDTKNSTKAMDVAQSAIGLVTGLKKTWKKAKKLTKGFSVEGAWGVGKYLADATKLALTINRWANHTVPGQVKISGDSDVSISGGRQASMYGMQSASVSSLISASLYGLTASVKGFAYASLFGGMDASVKAYRTASLSSEFGEAKLTSKSGTQVISEAGSVEVTAQTDVQLNSNTGNAYVHGLAKAYIGAGPGGGFGLKVTETEMNLGQIHGGAATFNNPSFKTKNKLHMKADLMELIIGSSKISLTPDGIEVFAKSGHGYKVDKNGNVAVKSKAKVLVG